MAEMDVGDAREETYIRKGKSIEDRERKTVIKEKEEENE